MKRLLALFVVVTMAAAMLPGVIPVAAAANELDKIINQEWIEVEDRRLVPLRRFCETLGARVDWDYDTEQATVTYEGNSIVMEDWGTDAIVNGIAVPIGQPIRIINDTMYGPLRFIAENLGFYVGWDPITETASIVGADGSTTFEPVDKGNIYKVVSVTASEDDGNKPANLLDRNYDTRWSAASAGAYVTLELEDVKPVAYIGIACYNGDQRQTTISVQVSEDGVTYHEVVTKTVTSMTVDMEPISLNGTHNAKYVRVLGYGNTQNYWNSVTELSVYGPMNDGSMPVATDGPGAASGSMENLTASEKAALNQFEQKFSRLDKWYANLYDQETGGFFMSKSGKDDPAISTGIEMTFYALGGITGNADIGDSMPEAIKQRFINYLVERQDPATGYFVDKQGVSNDRETSRTNATGISWVNRWKIELPYVHPSQRDTGSNSVDAADTTIMPEYFASVDTYIDWVESFDWDNNSWGAGDRVQQSVAYLNYMSEEQYNEYKTAVLTWLENRQFENGLWAPEINFNSVSGAFKVGVLYSNLSEQLPNPDKILDSVIACYELDVPTAVHEIRNPLSVMNQIAGYGSAYTERVKKAVADNMDAIVEWFNLFLCPDGGFSKNEKQSMTHFGGIEGSHGLWEGDVDSTMMALIARNIIYSMMGVKTPKLDFDDNFWSWISGDMETPSPYLSEITDTGKNVQDVSFDDMEIGALNGSEFGGTTITNDALQVEITKDPYKADNKVLSMTYDGSLDASPSFAMMFGSGGGQILYVPGSDDTSVVEYDMCFKNCSSGSNYYISYGPANAYMLNFASSGKMRVGIRIDAAKTEYNGAIGTLNPNEWYKIRLEYTMGETPKDLVCKIYIDGELVSTNNYYYFMEQGSEPKTVYGKLNFVWYKAASGTVYFDNFKCWKQ